MEPIYCLSGLGADQRVFQKLDIPGYELVPVHWAHYDQHDDVPCYAQKMSAQIPGDAPIILGVSFGGMIASEIAKIRQVKRTILVSSAKDATELRPVGSFMSFAAHHGLLPVGLGKFRFARKQLYKRFGVVGEEEQKLLVAIMSDTDNGLVRWAMKAMMDWRSVGFSPTIVHIHGTADRIIDPGYVKPDYWIKDGGHLMIYHNAAEIAAIISKHL